MKTQGPKCTNLNVYVVTLMLAFLLLMPVKSSGQEQSRILIYVTNIADSCAASSCGYTATTFDEMLPGILEAIGFQVDVVERDPTMQIITADFLSPFDQLWVLSSAEDYFVDFYDSEIEAILNFREAGKGLYIAADNSGWGYYAATANRISDALGVHFSGIINHTGGVAQACISPDLNIPDHPVLSNITELGQGRNDGSFTAVAPVEIIASHMGYPLLATLDDGKGRCVFDVIITRAFDPFAYYCDNETLFQNIATWLLEPFFGDICGTVTKIDGSPVPGITVTVLDQNNDPVGDPITTDENGEAYFDSITVGQYSVMIVTPLGYIVSPAETQTNVSVISGDCTAVNFILTPTVVTNDSRTIGYWKHQFNVYTSNRGNAQESYSDLETYLNLVHQHFSVLGVYVDIENFNLDDAKNVLTVRGGSLMLDRAKQQLFALLLNLASGKIGQETVVSDDGRVSAEAVTYASNLINDGDPENDELAKDICDLTNNGQLVEAGIIPESPVRYKFVPDVRPRALYSVQNYPNPFNAQTTINFTLPNASHVKIEVYDLLGRSVAVLADNELPAGYHSVTWDATAQSSGMYFYKIQAGEFIETKKMLLLK